MPKLPTRDQLGIWREFIETTEALRNRLAARLLADSGLSPGDYAVLLALSEAPRNRLRSSELAATIGWERSRLSHHLGRMERRGLISRDTEVELASPGAEAFHGATVPHLTAVRELFVDALSPEQLTSLAEITRALGASARDHDGLA
ncbi:MarR family winged helix-turn-helix transcriptional regulator [Actinoplanes sp. GCM10030250]|uniref:MarR family winged helix-turn-helix transcriptional regulator n=1 Tax=Actinoplanes sp. GCM10030250 TaxID=3273376 RepID=UPI003616D9E7